MNAPAALRVLVVDDEPPARLRLRQLCAELPDVQVVAEAGNGEQALLLARQHVPEVVLLDIRMPGKDGLETAREFAHLPLPPAVILVTAYDQHALEAFDAAASAYLLKPVRKEQLAAALARVRRPTLAQVATLVPPPDAPGLLVRTTQAQGTQWHRVPVASVMACVADLKYVTLHTTEGDFLVETPLRELEEAQPDRWLRVHRGALVAPAHVLHATRAADGGLAIAFRGSDLVVHASRRLAPEVLRRLGAPPGVCDTRSP